MVPLKSLAYFIIVGALAGYLYNEKIKIYNDCLPLSAMQLRMFKDGYSYVGTFTEGRYVKAVQVFINHPTRTFVLIGTDYETLQGCTLIKGFNWSPILGG